MERKERNSEADSRADFGRWLRQQLESRGYDLRIRGGGQGKFAEDSGIGRATISRILSGQGATDTRVLAQLAAALHIPLGEVLVRAGILDPSELRAVQEPPAPGERRITPEQAAEELGLTDEHRRRLFVNMTQTLQRTAPEGGQSTAGH
ncbi:helix-turn-helix transcriptional regulator [Streptomyces sp. NBC_00124]|uniref:helix-turn-helix domain-containing protein n=1 Tax=Streptomyces sp. NBC_00124 TaxID=2975662 RepID=UPI00225A9F25|nr:helix-turn-helix transcriptional regulator [Streptomyces sp. NBC_00124]MCX5362916.1 helix-turn-helix transcriptional regulator [Streptomyces sp. NBC_00124]